VARYYKRAISGEIPGEMAATMAMTPWFERTSHTKPIYTSRGISDPYEAPLEPEATIHSGTETPEESLDRIWTVLEARHLVHAGPNKSVAADIG
jgi:hypothetical protein